MKHLLIILSILLLSSPLFGQETGVLYLYESSSGFVWKSFEDKDIQPKYKGQVENGKPNGQGTYTYHHGFKYVGEWKDGKRNGQGTETFPDGGKYIGEYKDDKRWNGTQYDKDGNITKKYVNGVKQK